MKTLSALLLFFGLSFTAYGLDKKTSLKDLHIKHSIKVGELSELRTEDLAGNSCHVGFHVQSRRFFNTRGNANLFCDDINRFSRFGNLCHVRQYSDGFYGSSFSYIGFGSGRNFFNVFENILDFLLDTGLLNQLFGLQFDLQGSRGC